MSNQYRNPRIVQWYGKEWIDFTSSDKAALKQHYAELVSMRGAEAADGYMKFLNQTCGVPRNFN